MSPHHATTKAATIYKALLLLAAIVSGSLLAFYLSKQDLLGRAQEISAWINSLGWTAPLVFTALTAVLIAVGFPRLLLCSLGGLAFGFAWGLFWSHLGALAGAYATFMFSRRLGHRFTFKKWARLRRLSRLVNEQGVLSVLVIRQMPLSSFQINIFLGLTPVKQRDFALGSIIGFMPGAIPAVLIGASAVQMDTGKIIQYLLTALVLVIAFAAIMRWLRRSPRSPLAKARQKPLYLAVTEKETSGDCY